MALRDKGLGCVAWFALYGALAYGVVWFACFLPLFGYEEQWSGPDEAFYTVGSMTAVEQVAYLVGRYALSFPIGLSYWFGDFSFNPAVALCNGAVVGSVVGWLRGRPAHAAVGPAAAGRQHA